VKNTTNDSGPAQPTSQRTPPSRNTLNNPRPRPHKTSNSPTTTPHIRTKQTHRTQRLARRPARPSTLTPPKQTLNTKTKKHATPNIGKNPRQQRRAHPHTGKQLDRIPDNRKPSKRSHQNQQRRPIPSHHHTLPHTINQNRNHRRNQHQTPRHITPISIQKRIQHHSRPRKEPISIVHHETQPPERRALSLVLATCHPASFLQANNRLYTPGDVANQTDTSTFNDCGRGPAHTAGSVEREYAKNAVSPNARPRTHHRQMLKPQPHAHPVPPKQPNPQET
jgi:hypothetical protein